MVVTIFAIKRLATDIKDQVIDQQIQPSVFDKVIIPNFISNLNSR